MPDAVVVEGLLAEGEERMLQVSGTMARVSAALS